MTETSFGKYQLQELLGRGGMGEVWRAHDTVIDRTVAIKILSAEISKDEVYQQRFRREAQIVARLNSPHIVPIHTHGEIEGRLFLDMRLVEGRDLQSLLDGGRLPPAQAVHVVEQIAKALRSAHKVGLLHRDVKPSNILIDNDDDYAYLIDFGIARAAGERKLTTVGGVIGTFHYMAPERFKTQDATSPPIDARSDIYALACVLYECLTAAHAFPGDSLEQQVANHLVSPPPRPSAVNPELPPGFDAVIAKGMAKEPDDRYATATELARAARGVLNESGGFAWQPELEQTAPVSFAGNDPPSTVRALGASGEETLKTPLPTVVTGPGRVADLASVDSGPGKPRPDASVAPWWRRKNVLVSGVSLVAVIAVAAAVVTVVGRLGAESDELDAPLQPIGKPQTPMQTALPFTGLRKPEGLTVDKSGNVYVADTMHNTISVLPRGAAAPTPLREFDDLSGPTGVTVDDTGAIYVNDAGHKRVLFLPVGSTKPITLPFSNLEHPTGLTVDSAHTVYVTDTAKNQVVGLPANSKDPTAQFTVPFIGLNAPTGLTITPDGTMYVADGGNNKVLKMAPGHTQVPVPFGDLRDPGGVTVDSAGAVYVTDSAGNRALKLPAGATQAKELPFHGLDYPWGLAVDGQGTVYVAGHNDKVLALRQN